MHSGNQQGVTREGSYHEVTGSMGKLMGTSEPIAMTANHNLSRHYLRSVSSSTTNSPEVCVTGSDNVSNSPGSDRSLDSPKNGRALKKKGSIWNIFSRRKTSTVEENTKDTLDVHLSPISNKSVANTLSFEDSFLPLSARSSSSQRACGPFYSNTRTLRSQQSLHTLRSQASTPTLRSARSQYALRRPSGMQYLDNDSMFSDDSDTEMVVSWVTSTGLRRAGLSDDDEVMIELRR